MTATFISFSVPGDPKPQGSKRAFIVHGKDGKLHAPLVEQSKGVKPWRAVISLAARDAMRLAGHPGWFNKEALALSLLFQLPKPKTLPKKRQYPVVRPDLDKLTRAVMDALKNVLYGDDGQVVQLHPQKEYGIPGVAIRCDEL